MAHPSLPPFHLAAALAVALLAAPGGAWAQRSTVAPLVTAQPSARITLSEILAVEVDSTFVLLRPSLFEPRSVLRLERGRWAAVQRAFERDSLRALREVVGKVVALDGDGEPVGGGRVRAVRPDRCAEPPAWCPPTAVVEIVGEVEAIDQLQPGPYEVRIGQPCSRTAPRRVGRLIAPAGIFTKRKGRRRWRRPRYPLKLKDQPRR